jgi:hypothetical protein
MKKTLATFAILAGTLLLAACGNGDGKLSNGGGTPTPTTTTSTVALGSGSGAGFQTGVLRVAVSDLSAGGSTTISANLQYEDGTPYTKSATITFTSPCYQNDLASFSVNGQPVNTVTTSTGQANITYTATGCSGTDTITATTTVDDQDLSATGTVNVKSADVGSIQFVSATPQIISLKGNGGPENSTVIFKVVDVAGGPVADAHVSFDLNTHAGGVTLTPSSATTGSNGQAQTVVQAGTQHTSVRVTASTPITSGHAQTMISTQSPGIVISTGLATEKHFSLSLEKHSVEGFGLDGVTDKVSVILSDRFGNPVPDGTTVAFTTNGGQIEPSCATTDGTCSVTWTSANPRPPATVSSPGLSVIGHAEILAYATGEESFTDVNGDGIIDAGDLFSLRDGRKGNFFSPPSHDDIGEIYLDQNENGSHDKGEYFFDFNEDGQWNEPNGKFDGNGCKSSNSPPPHGRCGDSTTGVGLQTCIVMATSSVSITASPPTLTVMPGKTVLFSVYDGNGNAPPAGMKFSISADGPTAKIEQGSTVPDRIGCNSSYSLGVSVSSDSKSGTFTIVATSPTSDSVSYSDSITVQ